MRKLIEKTYEYIGLPNDGYNNVAEILSWITFIILVIFLVIRVGLGMADANEPTKCRATSLNDIILSPAYTVGCNLAKNRFDLKLN